MIFFARAVTGVQPYLPDTAGEDELWKKRSGWLNAEGWSL
jgi:hypothetical protein